MHTDDTMQIFQRVTCELGNELHFFRDTCTAFTTKELRREAECRRRKEAHAAPLTTVTTSSTTTNNRRPKVLNLNTYKLHALSDYPSQIKLFGTTDSFSTQLVCNWFFSLHGTITEVVLTGEIGASD